MGDQHGHIGDQLMYASMPAIKEERGRKLDACFSAKKPDWRSPASILDLVGPIALDPCTGLDNPTGAMFFCVSPDEWDKFQALEFPFTVNGYRDGLAQDWCDLSQGGMVFVNCPYGPGIDEWLSKGFTEAEEAIYLLPARTCTKWFHRLPRNVTKCFIKGRLKFKGANASAPFPSLVLYHGPNRANFVERFSSVGMILS